jgi:hypothetical protein
MAYDALASAYVLFFDYPEAAETFDKISQIEHFPKAERRESAKQALNLYASLGDTKGQTRAKKRFFDLGASAEEQAEADYVVAAAALKEWDQNSPDSGANKAARQRAEFQMRAYHDTNRNKPAAAKYVVEAAYWVAKMKRAGKDNRENSWWKSTMDAFERYKAGAPKKEDGTSQAVGSRWASFAAEGAYVLLDQQIKKEYDYESGHHHFKGTPVEVLSDYKKAADDAKKWFDQLQDIVDRYASPEWATASIARQGSIYDSLRTGLYNTQPPELKMFDKKTEALLLKAEESDNLELQEKADAIRMSVETAWRDKRDQELASADEIMVTQYSQSILFARRYNVSNPAVVRAIQRLAFFTEIIGEAKLKQYTANVKDLNYTEGMFTRIRPGMVTAPKASGLPAPLPAAPRQ